MTPMADILNRWRNNNATPVFVGAAPEGQLPPYVVLSEQTTMQQRATQNVVCWNQTSVSFTAVASTSAESGQLADYADFLYNQKSFSSVADMTQTMRSVYFSDTPSLTGSRVWVTSVDYTIKH